MIFKKRDKVRPVNEKIKSLHCPSWHPDRKRLEKLLTEEQSKRYTSEFIDFKANLHIYKVIGYINQQEVCVEDIHTRDICVFNETELTYLDNRVKEYNIPEFVDSEISKIIVAGRYVKVILRNGAEGVALCNDSDDFHEDIGINIAYLRAQANSIGGKGYYEQI